MKNILFIILFSSTCVYGQKKTFTISGIATNCKGGKALANMPVYLMAEDNFREEVLTDSQGKYSFKITPSRLPLTYMIFPNSTVSPHKVFGLSEGKIMFKLSDTSKITRIENFCLNTIIEKPESIQLAGITFKERSIEYQTENEYSIGRVINNMKNFPAAVYMITGMKVIGDGIDDSLYYKRANVIKQKITAAGIDPERVTIDKDPREWPDDGTGHSPVNEIFFRFLGEIYVPKTK